MSKRPDTAKDDPMRDEELAALYRAQAIEEPSAAHDARILDAAEREPARAASKRRSPWPWHRLRLGFSIAAVLIVAVSATLALREGSGPTAGSLVALNLAAPAAGPAQGTSAPSSKTLSGAAAPAPAAPEPPARSAPSSPASSDQGLRPSLGAARIAKAPQTVAPPLAKQVDPAMNRESTGAAGFSGRAPKNLADKAGAEDAPPKPLAAARAFPGSGAVSSLAPASPSSARVQDADRTQVASALPEGVTGAPPVVPPYVMVPVPAPSPPAPSAPPPSAPPPSAPAAAATVRPVPTTVAPGAPLVAQVPAPASASASASEPAPAPAPAPAGPGTTRSSEGASNPRTANQLARVTLSPMQWIEKIRALRRDNRQEEAAKALAEFKDHYPDYILPEDLRTVP